MSSDEKESILAGLDARWWQERCEAAEAEVKRLKAMAKAQNDPELDQSQSWPGPCAATLRP